MHEQPVSYDVGAHGNADVENQSVKLGKQMLSYRARSVGVFFSFACLRQMSNHQFTSEFLPDCFGDSFTPVSCIWHHDLTTGTCASF